MNLLPLIGAALLAILSTYFTARLAVTHKELMSFYNKDIEFLFIHIILCMALTILYFILYIGVTNTLTC